MESLSQQCILRTTDSCMTLVNKDNKSVVNNKNILDN